jgi:hypothetical protein
VRDVATSTIDVPASTDRPASPRPAVAWLPIGSAVAAAVVALAATSARYGYHRDELYFLMLPPQWGYVDQPPLTPLLARAAAALFGDTPTGLRVAAMACVAVGIVLAGLTARELGGRRGAQTLAAWGIAFAGIPMLSGHLMITATVDLPFWAATLLLVTRALLRNEPRWWLWAGVVVGLGLYNKLLIVMLLLSLAIGFAIVGPRRTLWSRHVWAGVGLAVLVGAPNLIYQATHHFPQVTMAGAIADDSNRITLLPYQLVLVGLPLVPVCVAGFVALMRRPEWRALRAVPIAYLASLVITLIGAGQGYYPFSLLEFLFVAGTVPTVDWIARRRPTLRRSLVVAATALNGVLSVLIALPFLPVDVVGHTPVVAINPAVGDQVGWPTYVRTLAGVYQSLPADDQAHAVILAGNYGEAGAVVHYGKQYGLPSVYSGHNELYDHGPPPAADTIVVAWTEGPSFVSGILAGCEQRATMANGVGVKNEEEGSAVLVCHLPPGGWAAAWPLLQHDS